jgi:hypothetical protein
MSRLRNRRELASANGDFVVSRLLEKLASILLRLGLDSPYAESLIRHAFVLEAVKRARQIGARNTQSQVALLAGVSRLDVRKILARKNHSRSSGTLNRRSRGERVLLAWCQDPEFSNKLGRPKPLTFIGAHSQFEKLIRKYGRDVTARTLREDLIKNRLVTQEGARLVLKKRGRPRGGSQDSALLDLNLLESQLAQFDFSKGRRDFLERRLSLTTNDSKVIKLAQRKAISKIETTLSSLQSLQRSLTSSEGSRNKRAYRLLITTIISTESEGADD